jgi:glycosyltransferase involved in cell wall biosynthesis
MSKLSIIIPVYNEESTILQILNKIEKVVLINNIEKEYIIVNDFSSDNSEKLILNFINNNTSMNITYLFHLKNLGKGAAIHHGINKSTGDYIIIQDADMEYDPIEYNILLKLLVDNIADVVYGSRFIGGNPHRILFFWHTIGNKFLTFLSNLFNNLNLTDMETCYKMFRSKILKSITLNECRFGFEPEVTAKIAKINNIRIYEVGISYYGRTYKEGKKINWKDGFNAIKCIIKYGI